jgi:hypothetical protein
VIRAYSGRFLRTETSQEALFCSEGQFISTLFDW